MGQTEPGVTALHLPLSGFRIISAEQYGAGPYGTMFLAQLGAEVIKIEPPSKANAPGGDTARGVGPHFLRKDESNSQASAQLVVPAVRVLVVGSQMGLTNEGQPASPTRTEEERLKQEQQRLAARSVVLAVPEPLLRFRPGAANR